MSFIKNYLQNFLKRAGSYVLTATVISRVFSFFASWLALQFIPNKELGIVLFSYNIVVFIIPIGGFGLHQSLIRYGALLKTDEEKDSLFVYVFKKGIATSSIIILMIIVAAIFIPFQFEKTSNYLILLSFLIIPTFTLEIIKAQFRLKYDNKSFAFTEVVYSIVFLISIFILSYFYKEVGYAIALLITPLITSLLFIKKLNINFSTKIKLPIINFSFWKYGFFASLSNVVTQLLFVIDILLIGYLLQDAEMVTNYKYVSLIPFSLLFLPRVFITTDFVAFTENIYDKRYIVNYIKSYTFLFFLISILLCVFCTVFSHQVLEIFDENFVQYADTFIILIFGITGIYILRGLYGNLLSSIGKAHINYYIISFALFVNILSNYYLIPIYGITGAAITTAVLMWITGFSSMICFWYFYKKELRNKPV